MTAITDARILDLAREHVSPYLAGCHPQWFIAFARALLAEAARQHAAELLSVRAALDGEASMTPVGVDQLARAELDGQQPALDGKP